jgi:hypothetical protein
MKRIDNGVRTALGGTGTDGISAGENVYLEASGTSIKLVVNDTDSPLGAQTDATYSTGYAGVSTRSANAGTVLTAWEGGTLGAPPAENYLPSIATRHLATLRGE